MTQKTKDSIGDELLKKAFIASAASVAGAIVGSLLLPGAGTALGAKLGAILGGSGGS